MEHDHILNGVQNHSQQQFNDCASSESGSNGGAVFVEGEESDMSLNSSNVSIPSAISGVAGRAAHNSGASQDSSSEGDFVRFEQDELAEIPADLLADYGNRMAYDVLNQITHGENNLNSVAINGSRHHSRQQQNAPVDSSGNIAITSQQSPQTDGVSTPLTDELASPISNYMEQGFIIQEQSPHAADPPHEVVQDSHSAEQQESFHHQPAHDGQAHNEDTRLDHSDSEFDPLAGRTSFDSHEEPAHHGDEISDIQFGAYENVNYEKENDSKLNVDDSILIQPDEESSQPAADFGHTDRPEVTPVGESDSLKALSTDSDIEALTEPAPHSYDKPTETSQAQPDDEPHQNEEDPTWEKPPVQVDENLVAAVDEDAVKQEQSEPSWMQEEVVPAKRFVEDVEAALSQPAARSSNDAPSETEKDDESDHDDTLASLPSESKVHGDAQSPTDEEAAHFPESSSITGMRDFTADGAEDEEELIQARAGRPLMIPPEAVAAAGATAAVAAAGAAALLSHPHKEEKEEEIEQKHTHEVATEPPEHRLIAQESHASAQTPSTPNVREDEPPIPSNWPIRPPTPPKSPEDSEDEGEKPSVMDLGPPPPSHFLAHRTSISGLHSILKRHEDKAWITGFTDPCILDIVYWRDPKRSGIALTACLVVLYLFSQCTVLSVFAYTALAILGSAIGFRVFKLVEARFKNTDGSNPFKQYLEQEVVVPQEKLHAQVEVFVEHAQCAFKCLRHLFLVENLVDSVKFGLLLYTLTYIGAWFSGLTLAFFFVIGLFAVPKIYETNKEPIDHYLALAQEHLEKVQHTIEDKLPFLKKQVDAEKKEH